MTPWFCSALAICLLVPIAWGGSRPVDIEGQGQALDGMVFEPEGEGPHPAVVMLHGCSGMFDREGRVAAIYRTWAARLVEEGYVGLLVDSFGKRGIKEICTQAERTLSAGRDRARDAYAGLDWLRTRKNVDPSRIYLLGWSNGGGAVLGAMDSDAPLLGERKAGFRAAVAMYPGCRGFLRKAGYRPRAPLLIQIGDADDWTPAERCRELLASRRSGGPEWVLEVYPHAHHAFDRPGDKVVFREEVWNASRGKRGATVAGNPAARTAAIERAVEFMAKH